MLRTSSRLAVAIRANRVRFTQSRMASNLRQRAIVSSFICTSPQSITGLTFALFKRSQDVSTYPGKWAVCSGSIDDTDSSPEYAAKREISEETTLDDNDIILLRRGKPFSLIDEKLKTEWTIHPFAWELKPNAKSIKLDWEHTEYHFVKPNDMEKYDHVPQLDVGMKRVLVSDETEKGLAVLRNDHESGAQALAVKALEILLQFVRGDEMAKLSDSEEFWKELKWRAWHLAKNGRPSMGAAIQSGVFRALAAVEIKRRDARSLSKHANPLQAAKSITELSIEATIVERTNTLQTLASRFVEFIEKSYSSQDEDRKSRNLTKIITLSSSGTLTKCLAGLIEHSCKNGQHIKLSVLESRPNFEGVSFVNNLLSSLEKTAAVLAGLKIEIVSDSSMASVVKDADYLIIGGDKVLQNGDVSNKIGSLPAAVLAKSLNPHCQVVAVFETSKIVHSGFDSGHAKTEYNDPVEVTSAWPKGLLSEFKEKSSLGFQLEVRNAYFEWVPTRYIDTFISEVGVIELGDIAKLSAESFDLERKLFDDF